ncbi:DNA-binding GntR family transcriptional regulator [Thermocatellispora tengchongensis]|uniref:DNA-binding GntR family transcriptional regulator n=1 Tax=Thermocatellispora tengchongensis TaxID=1073253 RepID=A0A840PS62_9ACTN|nr:UTRA domain-containing protein [Thermocatellispora tengchongensis]MBB5138795.1 DNA-binding GntR family transcriptional regulator [Thermocatellispora tengchongensis]
MSVSTAYVRPRRAGRQEAWAEEAAAQGKAGTQELREVGEVAPPAEVAGALGVAAGESVVVRRRVILLDGHPVELADSYYPGWIARGTPLAEYRKIRGGAITLLGELGHAPRHVEEDVSARPATDEERRLLRLREHEYVLVLFRLMTADDGTPIEASVMTMNTESRHLRYALDL